jgi:flagellin-like hook-associated protein FlgL
MKYGGDGASGSESLWLALIHTRKALDVAVGALQQIATKYETEIAKLFESQKWWTCAISMCDCADKALEQITALEQKD